MCAMLSVEAVEGRWQKNARMLRANTSVIQWRKGCHIDRTRQPDSGGFHPRCGFLLFTLQERRKL
ncbi:hypothetical protein EIG11_14160 [Escherichia coli]|nr:hypothetical protein [Escherichia coli]